MAMGFAVNRRDPEGPRLMTPTSEVLQVGVPTEVAGPAGNAVSLWGFFCAPRRPSGRGNWRGGAEGSAVKQRLELVRTCLLQLVRYKMICLLVGGAAGTCVRYWVARWCDSQPWGQVFPYGTFFINVSGSLLLAFAAVVIRGRLPPEYGDLYLLIGTGFCGGYTTFSTFEWETFRLVQSGSWPLALVNVIGSVAAGFVGVLLGVKVAEFLFPQG
jgi:CrcB protein